MPKAVGGWRTTKEKMNRSQRPRGAVKRIVPGARKKRKTEATRPEPELQADVVELPQQGPALPQALDSAVAENEDPDSRDIGAQDTNSKPTARVEELKQIRHYAGLARRLDIGEPVRERGIDDDVPSLTLVRNLRYAKILSPQMRILVNTAALRKQFIGMHKTSTGREECSAELGQDKPGITPQDKYPFLNAFCRQSQRRRCKSRQRFQRMV